MDLPSTQRSSVIAEFSRGVARISTCLDIKLAWLDNMPLKLLVLGHAKEDVVARESGVVVNLLERFVESMNPDTEEDMIALDNMYQNLLFFLDHIEHLQALASGAERRADLPSEMQRRMRRFAMAQFVEIRIEAKHSLLKCRMARRNSSHPAPANGKHRAAAQRVQEARG